MPIYNLASVALPLPLNQLYDYEIPSSSVIPAAGARVKVNFGHRELVGVVVRVWQTDSIASNIKTLEEILDSEALLTAELLSLCEWAADYYLHPLGEVISGALPPGLRQQKATPAIEYWLLSSDGKGLGMDALKRSPKQQAILRHLLNHGKLEVSGTAKHGFSASALQGLAKKGLLIKQRSSQAPEQESHSALLKENPRQLNPEQETALHSVLFHRFSAYLLEGATGSGKTEVYLQLCAHALQLGLQVLILIPEIGLTPQTVERFRQRFHAPIAELHSNVSEAERTQNWMAARNGSAKIVIGTRLAAFVPLQKPGLIIVDEEHDNSYKQQDTLRYSARDLCIVRAKRNGIPVVLGSATPSLESLLNAQQQRYQWLQLTQRAGTAVAPILSPVDLRDQALKGGLCEFSLQKIKAALDRKQQCLVFLNRRGFAPYVVCHHCGWVAECRACSANMTLHHQPARLHCHHCNARSAIPRLCPACDNPKLVSRGLGTEQTEAVLTKAFPEAKILRVDRDSTRGKTALRDTLQMLHSGEPCIIVGTQMLAKGHHLPNLNLVVIVDADQGLLSPDFRGVEKMGQLIVQVTGRAGREQERGEVIIQSHRSEHPYLQLLLTEGYRALALQLMHDRNRSQLPPHWAMAVFRAESKRAENALELLNVLYSEWKNTFPPSEKLRAIGPTPCGIERIQDRFRFQLVFKADSKKGLREVLEKLMKSVENNALAKRTRWSLDIDPIEV